MADQSLQAFQLGASLFDRAQTQQRMMEQMQMQTADQLMRQRQYDLQNKIQSNAYAQALAEQANQAAEYDTFQAFNQQVSDFLNNTAEGASMPALPRFKSKQFNQEATRLVNGLEPYSARAELIKKQTKAAALADQLEGKRYDNAIKYNALTRTDDGKYVIDDALIATKRAEEERTKKLRDMSLTGQRWTREGLKSALDSGTIDQQEYDQLLSTARVEGGVVEQRTQKNIKDLVDEGLLDPNNKVDVATASRAIRSNLKTPTKIIDSITASDSATNQLDNALQKIQAFNAKYGANAFDQYVGPVDEPLFRAEGKFKGLTAAEKQTARTIQQQIAQVVQNYRRGIFGQTLQPNEQKNMDDIVGTARGNDYLVLVGGFNDNLKSGLKRTISNYKFNADIPIDIKRTHAPEIFVSSQQQSVGPKVQEEQPISPQDVFKNIRANRPQGGTIQPATSPAANRVGRFEILVEGQ